MKENILKFATLLLVGMVISFGSSAQFVIKVRPVAPIVRVHPGRPGPRHVWVDREYVWRGGQYVYQDGYWAMPPAHRNHWIEGRWKHRRGGWVWMPGHWR